MRFQRVGLALLLTACASSGGPPEPVSTPDAAPLTRVNPEGFESCIQDGAEDDIAIRVLLTTTPDGFVDDAQITSSQDACFDAATLKAVKQWRYPPLLRGGELVARKNVKAVIVYRFKDQPQD